MFRTHEKNLFSVKGECKFVFKYSNIQTYNFAIGSQIEEREVYYQENSEWNSSIKEGNENAKKNAAVQEIIKVNTVDNFVKDKEINKINFLKSDTEGFELEVLHGSKICLNNQLIDVLYVEVGFSKMDLQHTYWVEIVEYLEKHDYTFSGFFEVGYEDNIRITYGNALFLSKNFSNSIVSKKIVVDDTSKPILNIHSP